MQAILESEITEAREAQETLNTFQKVGRNLTADVTGVFISRSSFRELLTIEETLDWWTSKRQNTKIWLSSEVQLLRVIGDFTWMMSCYFPCKCYRYLVINVIMR